MTPRTLRSFRLKSTALLAVFFVVSAARAAAQARPAPGRDTLTTRVRDSIIAAVLADTADIDVDTIGLLPPISALRQSFTIRPTLRHYTVGSVNATEQASYASWVARFRRAAIRVDLTPVAYSGDTSTTADRPEVTFGGVSPISGRVDFALRHADTLRVFAQSMSFPGALSAIDAQALGTVGTSTIDLDAGAIGAAARIGTRYIVTQPIGSSGVALSLRGGIEYDPKPSGTESVSWRGTTVRGGIGLARTTDLVNLGANVELTRSFADSLDGRNLFPGGGALTIDARALRFLGADGTSFLSLSAFYSKPLNIERPDQPTRLIPIGDFAGVTASSAFPLGPVTVLPVVSYVRESSNATAIVSGRATTLDASGYTGSASLGLAIPLGSVVTITPEVGGALGNVGQTVSAQFPRRVRRRSFNDSVRGGWVSLELSFTR